MEVYTRVFALDMVATLAVRFPGSGGMPLRFYRHCRH